jgi:hypothetical protein
VLVSARREEHIIPAQPAPAGVGIGEHAREHVADVRGAVDVEYGGGNQHAALGFGRFFFVKQGALHEIGNKTTE